MSKEFVNIEEIVKNWAWREYQRTESSAQRKLRQKHEKEKCIDAKIDWSAVSFNDITSWGKDGKDTTAVTNGASVTCPSTAGPDLQPQQLTTSVLFETRYVNNTRETQDYTMRTEKTTRSSMITEVQKGLTKGCEMGITLKTPCEVLEANVGFKREVTLTNTNGQAFEEELTWGVDSNIRVKPDHVAEACLVVTESKKTRKFTIKSEISGMVYVTFTNFAKNNAFVKETGHDIAEIVKVYKDQESRKGNDCSLVKVEDRVVVVTTEGTCEFQYGIKQEVKVNQFEISS